MSKSDSRPLQRAFALAVAAAAIAALPQAALAQSNSAGTQRGIIAVLKPGEHPGGVNRATASMKNPGPPSRTRLRDPGPSQAPGATGMIDPGPQQAPGAQGGLIGLLKQGAHAPAQQKTR